MFFTKQGVFSSLILFGGVFFSSWLAVKSTVFQEPSQDKNQIVGIGYHLKDWQMAENGDLESFTKFEKMLHYADGRSQFFGVKGQYFDLTNREDPPWNIASLLGFMSSDHRFVELKNNVVIQRIRTPRSAALEAQTTELTYDRKLNQVYTDAFVTLREPDLGNITTGTGLRANLNENEVKLLKDVHTLYTVESQEASS